MAKMTKEYLMEKLLELSVKEKTSDNQIHNARDVFDSLKGYAHADEERFWVITLNGAHRIKNVHCVSKGIVNKCIVHPREVFRKAISDNAQAIIIAHIDFTHKFFQFRITY
jgi:DNA repair protein RadC